MSPSASLWDHHRGRRVRRSRSHRKVYFAQRRTPAGSSRNFWGAFYCAREALERMVARRQGVIVNVTSVHEQIPWGGYSAYTASKAGLGMLTRTLAQEGARHGVRVLAVAPGAIRTPINESVWEDPRARADLLRKIPMGRLGRPEEIAQLVVVLASDVASYLTGTTLFVDGGMTLYADFAHGG